MTLGIGSDSAPGTGSRPRPATLVALVALLAIAPGAALAGGMKLTPGKWQFTATTDMPLAPRRRPSSSA